MSTEVRFTPRRTDCAFRGGRRDLEEYLGTAHTIGNRFDDNSTAPAALTPAADAAEIVEETQKRTSASTSPYHACPPLERSSSFSGSSWSSLIILARVISRDGFLRDFPHETLLGFCSSPGKHHLIPPVRDH